eukprot:356395-Chlamydomonas_euryale.AAC.13
MQTSKPGRFTNHAWQPVPLTPGRLPHPTPHTLTPKRTSTPSERRWPRMCLSSATRRSVPRWGFPATRIDCCKRMQGKRGRRRADNSRGTMRRCRGSVLKGALSGADGGFGSNKVSKGASSGAEGLGVCGRGVGETRELSRHGASERRKPMQWGSRADVWGGVGWVGGQ